MRTNGGGRPYRLSLWLGPNPTVHWDERMVKMSGLQGKLRRFGAVEPKHRGIGLVTVSHKPNASAQQPVIRRWVTHSALEPKYGFWP